MFNKNGPYILLVALSLVLSFSLGVRLGQKVEKTNKTVDYIMSLKPTKTNLSPTPATPLAFTSYSDVVCGIKFLYPNTLNLGDESSSGAIFINDNKHESLKISCSEDDSLDTILKDQAVATAEVVFKSKKLTAKEITEDTNNSFYIFRIPNPINSKNLWIKIEKSLYPLFESTLQFIAK